jgi:4-diphosphocytidyl-2C-methyl-D-erythritol kinase
MTGTGSAVFGIFPDDAAAGRAAAQLREHCHTCVTARPVGVLMEE